jgi:hypothetical protein
VVWPLDASSGLVPASLVKAASLRQRPGWEKDTMAWAALTGGESGLVSQPGCKVIDDRGQWVAVGLERAGGLTQRHGESADLGVADGLVAAGVGRQAAAGQAGQDSVGGTVNLASELINSDLATAASSSTCPA